MPDAWCTTKRRLAPASSSAARAPGGASDCMATTALAATSAITSESACWSCSERARPVAVEVERAEP